jgi:hypothetical protein
VAARVANANAKPRHGALATDGERQCSKIHDLEALAKIGESRPSGRSKTFIRTPYGAGTCLACWHSPRKMTLEHVPFVIDFHTPRTQTSANYITILSLPFSLILAGISRQNLYREHLRSLSAYFT